MTHTKTFELLDAWAETTPWTCRAEGHDHSPMANQPCAIGRCGELLLRNEVCYAVTALERGGDGHEQWVCWRHVRPDDGPIRIDPKARHASTEGGTL
ncbi:hypothetical protein [Streptomyces mirabilis]|uniref:hypothetical protein n=1 Tax=Streptomyces mirabilis TaxID=68239 RepID=UPI003666C51B